MVMRSAPVLSMLALAAVCCGSPAWASCSDISGIGGPRLPCPDTRKIAPSAPAPTVKPTAPVQQRTTVRATSPSVPRPSAGGSLPGVLSGAAGLLSAIQQFDQPQAESEAEEPDVVEALPPPPVNPRACTDRERQTGCRGLRRSETDPTMDAADFSGQIRGDENYEVDLGAKGKRRPVTKCDSRGCWIEYVSAPPKKPTAGPPLRDVLRAKLDLQKLKDDGVPKSEHKTILLSKYPAEVVNRVIP